MKIQRQQIKFYYQCTVNNNSCIYSKKIYVEKKTSKVLESTISAIFITNAMTQRCCLSPCLEHLDSNLQQLVLQNPTNLTILVKLFLQLCYFLGSIFRKRYIWSINLKTLCWKLSISWMSLEAISSSYLDPKNRFPRLFMSS